jgi:hypothetical protein
VICIPSIFSFGMHLKPWNVWAGSDVSLNATQSSHTDVVRRNLAADISLKVTLLNLSPQVLVGFIRASQNSSGYAPSRSWPSASDSHLHARYEAPSSLGTSTGLSPSHSPLLLRTRNLQVIELRLQSTVSPKRAVDEGIELRQILRCTRSDGNIAVLKETYTFISTSGFHWYWSQVWTTTVLWSEVGPMVANKSRAFPFSNHSTNMTTFSNFSSSDA